MVPFRLGVLGCRAQDGGELLTPNDHLESFRMSAEKVPWAGNFFAMEKGGLAQRWQLQDFPQKPLKYSQVRRLNQEQLNKLSPIEKYDLMVGHKDFKATRRELKKRGPLRFTQPQEWEGFCNGVRCAGILLPEPKHSVIATSPLGQTVKFEPADLKALAGATYFYVEKYAQIGGPSRAGYAENQPHPAVFDVALRHGLARENQAFVIDSNTGPEIWNETVIGYKREAHPSVELTAEEKLKFPEGVQKTTIRLVLETLGEIDIRQSNAPTLKQIADGHMHSEVYTGYDLVTDKNGRVIDGIWHRTEDTRGVDFAWFVGGKGTDADFKRQGGNPYLNFETIKKLFDESTHPSCGKVLLLGRDGTVKKRMTISLFLAVNLVLTSLAQAISTEMHELVTLETRANAVATRSNQKVLLKHYEIPLSLLEADISKRVPKAYLDALVFKKADGKEYVRWIINPEDTKWHLEVAKFLTDNKVSPEIKTYFEGYKTASRSYIVVDPSNGAEFSIKVSTNNTGGAWVDKKQTWADAKQIRLITDYVMDQQAKQPSLEHSILLDEPVAFGIKALDQGMILRSYEGLAKSGKTYVPGFSIMHDKVGAMIAKTNGSEIPGEYWNESYNKPLARSLAEFFMLSGMTYDSPHSQNFLVELDEAKRPTGKIVLRDFGDTYLLKSIFKGLGRQSILDQWEASNLKDNSIRVSVGILHGNKPPTWMNMVHSTDEIKKGNNYYRWGYDFHKEFQKEMFRQTGLNLPASKVEPSGMYIGRSLNFDSPESGLYLNLTKEQKHRSYNGACEKLFLISP